MSVQFCLVLVALSSLAAASDPGCEELVKPLEDRSRVSGKWIFHAGASDNKELLKDLKTINSSWIELSPIPESNDMTLRWGDKIGMGEKVHEFNITLGDGKCHTGSVNATFSGDIFSVTFHFNASDHEHVGRYLVTCSECILWTDTSTTVGGVGGRKGKNLYLFTKSGRLDESDLEVFKKQAACLNVLPEFHFGESTDLCPDEKEAATDVKEEEQ